MRGEEQRALDLVVSRRLRRGQSVLVLRGWVPKSKLAAMERRGDDEAFVEGVIRTGEEVRGGVSARERRKGESQGRDGRRDFAVAEVARGT